jgi:TolB-like protein/Flp pilus assembly protein TadD
MKGLKRLIHEIHRRSLWQVLAVYAAAAWIALQVVNEIARSIHLPDWVSGAAVVLLVIGFPIVLATAFVQEGVGPRPDGSDGAADARSADDGSAGQTGSPAAVAAPAHQRLFTWRHALGGGAVAFALWGVVSAAWLVTGGRLSERTDSAATASVAGVEPMRSLAVLPFATRSEQREDVYFAEGMHDDLLTQLSKIDSLTVISRTSVLQYAGTQKRIPVIAQELGVTTVLEGGVQRSGSRIRVNVQLIEAATDRHLWAETYDEELTAANVFAIQSDLARKIAQALRATLSPAVARRIDVRPTESLEAYELYVRARYEYQTRGTYGESLEEIIRMFQQAIAADDGFAAAWSGLAHAYLAAWNWHRMAAAEAAPRAREAVARALAADPDLAEAHIAKARLLLFEDDPEQAEQEVLRALELNPGMAEAYARYADILELQRRPQEAIRAARRAVELDPAVVSHRNALADRLFYASDLEASIAESKRAIEMSGRDWYAWYNIGWAQAVLGRTDEAVESFRQAGLLTEDNKSSVNLGIAYAFARSGQGDSAQHYMGLVKPGAGGYDVGLVHFTLGDVDRAFRDIESALRADPRHYRQLLRDPSAAALRADPRFPAMVRRLGLD